MYHRASYNGTFLSSIIILVSLSVMYIQYRFLTGLHPHASPPLIPMLCTFGLFHLSPSVSSTLGCFHFSPVSFHASSSSPSGASVNTKARTSILSRLNTSFPLSRSGWRNDACGATKGHISTRPRSHPEPPRPPLPLRPLPHQLEKGSKREENTHSRPRRGRAPRPRCRNS
jgi:hypothetical protein